MAFLPTFAAKGKSRSLRRAKHPLSKTFIKEQKPMKTVTIYTDGKAGSAALFYVIPARR